MSRPQAIGLDLGTGGVRGVRLDPQGVPRAAARAALTAKRDAAGSHEHEPEALLAAVDDVLGRLLDDSGPGPLRIAIAGTSGSLLLADADTLRARSPCLLYDDSRSRDTAAALSARLPADSGAHGSGSSAARWLHLLQRFPHESDAATGNHTLLDTTRPMHPADWVAAQLAGQRLAIDHNNGLKLGLDPETGTWPPAFLEACARVLGLAVNAVNLARLRHALPQTAVEPGTPLAPLAGVWRTRLATRLSARQEITLCAGTTDSVAAFVATIAAPGSPSTRRPPDPLRVGVTSLGSTLVLKQLATTALRDPRSGVYSHRLGSRWLVGGASSSGGAALAQWFDAQAIAKHSARIDLDRPPRPCYPLPGRGERFPDPDADRVAVWPPRDNDTDFLHDLLAGIAAIEARGYRRLAALGAARLAEVHGNGGGAGNETWRRIRERVLGVPCPAAPSPRDPAPVDGGDAEGSGDSGPHHGKPRPASAAAEAAVGAALLAQRGADGVFEQDARKPRT